MPVSLSAQLDCVTREIRRRDAEYPGLIEAGTLTRDQANAEYAEMLAVVDTLQAAREARAVLEKALGAGAEQPRAATPRAATPTERRRSPERERKAELMRFERACHERGLTNDGIHSVCQSLGVGTIEHLSGRQLGDAADHIAGEGVEPDEGQRRAMALNADGYTRRAVAAIESAQNGKTRQALHASAVSSAEKRFEGELLAGVVASLDRAA